MRALLPFLLLTPRASAWALIARHPSGGMQPATLSLKLPNAVAKRAALSPLGLGGPSSDDEGKLSPPPRLAPRRVATLARSLHRLRAILVGLLFATVVIAGGGSAAHAATVPLQRPAVTTSVQVSDTRPSGSVTNAAMLGTLSSADWSTETRSRVVDDAGLLNAASRERLTKQLKAAEARTQSELVVVTLPTINGRDQKAYATNLFNSWEVGAASNHRGVLMLFVADGGKNRRGRIQVTSAAYPRECVTATRGCRVTAARDCPRISPLHRWRSGRALTHG